MKYTLTLIFGGMDFAHSLERIQKEQERVLLHKWAMIDYAEMDTL